MQINTVYVEAEEYRRLVEENAILNERMGRLYSYMAQQEIQSAKWSSEDGKKYDPAVRFDKVQKIVNYKRDLETNKIITKIEKEAEKNAEEAKA